MKSLFLFFIKSLIIFLFFFFPFFYYFYNLSPFNKEIKNIYNDEQNKIIILSFIQNTVALENMAERDVSKNNFKDAILKYQLAIGLFEMHGANEKYINDCEIKIANLSKKVKN